jgi:hypothetical protein
LVSDGSPFSRRVLSVLPPTTKAIVVSTGNFPDATRVTPDPVPRKKKNNDADLHAEIPTLKTPLDLMTGVLVALHFLEQSAYPFIIGVVSRTQIHHRQAVPN